MKIKLTGVNKCHFKRKKDDLIHSLKLIQIEKNLFYIDQNH